MLLAQALAVGHADRPLPPVLLVRHCDWDGERRLRAGAAGADGIRVALDGDRLWIGPRFGAGAPGCADCFRRRLRSNHPQPADWPQLFEDERPGIAADHPLTAPLLGMTAQLLWALADDRAAASVYFVLSCGDGKVERHRFFPAPTCVACATLPPDSADAADLRLMPRPRADPRRYRLPNPALDWASVEAAFVDRRSGLVKHVFQDTHSRLMPMAGAEAVMTDDFQPAIGYGRTPSVDHSRLVAVLESVERFASTRPRGRRTTVRATRAALGDTAIDPRLFTLHPPEQRDEPGFNLLPYHDELEQGWVWAYSWRRRGPVLMPEQMAYYGVVDEPGRLVNRYVQETSSGCALGGSLEEAALYGLFEVIERDAYMTGWLGECPFPPLDCADARDPAIGALLARARAEGYRVHLFDMTLESGVPSIWAMIEDPREGAPVRSYCAASAHLDPEKAVLAALVEVVSSISVYRASMPAAIERARQLVADPSGVQRMEDHVLLYSQPETIAWLDFLPRHAPAIALTERFAGWYAAEPPADMTTELERVVAAVLRVAHDVLIVDQTFDALKPLSLHAARVSVPGLNPVAFGHQFRRIAPERLRQAAAFLGLEGRLRQTPNPRPHNFP